MNHMGSGRQYTPMMEHVTCMVAVDTGNGHRCGANNNMVPCPSMALNCYGLEMKKFGLEKVRNYLLSKVWEPCRGVNKLCSQQSSIAGCRL